MTTSAAVDSKYSYVSYTRPDVTTSVEALIEATRNWTPIRGRIVPEFDFEGFRARHTDGLEPIATSGDSQVERILDVMLDPGHCRSLAQHVRGHPAVTEKIERSVAEGAPVRVVIPSYPGRPFSTLTHQRVQPDLSEAYGFVLLHRISMQVRSVHEPGVQFVILLDGKAYNPFYGYAPESEHQYPHDLQTLVDALGVQDTISFVDLQDLVDERRDEFEEIREQVLPEIEEHWHEPDNPFRDELVETMRLGTNAVAVTAAAVQLLRWPQEEPTTELIEAMREAVVARARETAFAYMVFLVTIRRMALIESAFGNAVRGTVHPKPGQYSPLLVHPTTRIAPWHGVAVVRPDGVVNTVYESKLYERPDRYCGVYLEGEYTPFFYEELPAG